MATELLPASLRMKAVKPHGPFTPTLDPMCICGDPLSEHTTVAASVPLENPTPIYPLPTYSPILTTYSGANYDMQQCRCGCVSFDHDQCEYRIGVNDGYSRRCALDYGHQEPHLPPA